MVVLNRFQLFYKLQTLLINALEILYFLIHPELFEFRLHNLRIVFRFLHQFQSSVVVPFRFVILRPDVVMRCHSRHFEPAFYVCFLNLGTKDFGIELEFPFALLLVHVGQTLKWVKYFGINFYYFLADLDDLFV